MVYRLAVTWQCISWLFAVALMLYGSLSCSVTRVEPKVITSSKAQEINLPISGGLLISNYVSSTDAIVVKADTQTFMTFVNPEKYPEYRYYLHKPSEHRLSAAKDVAALYFSSVYTGHTASSAHFVFKLTAKNSINYFSGAYHVELEGAFYTTSGDLLYKGEISKSVLAAKLFDENAFYNAYVKAMDDFFGKLFSEKGKLIMAHALTQPAIEVTPQAMFHRGILNQKASGSGTLINGNGDILTAYRNIKHCVAVSALIEERKYEASQLWTDGWSAILSTDYSREANLRLPPLADQPLPPKQQLQVESHAGCSTKFGTASVVEGRIISKHYIFDEPDIFRFTAETARCHQGGLVRNGKGEWLGINMGDIKFDHVPVVSIIGDADSRPRFDEQETDATGSPILYGVYSRPLIEQLNKLDITIEQDSSEISLSSGGTESYDNNSAPIEAAILCYQ